MIQWMNVNVVPPGVVIFDAVALTGLSHVPTHARFLLMELPMQW
jgi:hypothetical protein